MISQWECIERYKHNPQCIVPKGAVVDVIPDDNSFLIIATYKGRNMKLNFSVLRKYFIRRD